MRWFQRLTNQIRRRARRQPSTAKARFRRLLVEQFEDRRVLALAVDDYYAVDPNTTLTVNGFGAWSNDAYHATWENFEWVQESIWHDGYWEQPVCYDCVWQEPVWYEGYYDPPEDIWHDGYWENPVWYEGYWQEPQWFEGYYDENNEWHDGYWDPPEPVWHDGFYVPPEPVWHDGYWEYAVWHEGYWDPPEPVLLEGYWDPEEPVWHAGYWEGQWVFVSADYATSEITADPAHGTLTEIASGESCYYNGDPLGPCGLAFTYTPATNFKGAVSFTYTLTDDLETSTATVTIAVDRAPTPSNDSYSTAEDTPLTISAALGVLANDSDPESDPLTAYLLTNAANGAVALNANGSFTYTPSPNFNGSDSFVYGANDGLRTTAATVSVTVTPVNDPPIAINDSFTMFPGESLNIFVSQLVANDSDPEGDPLTASIASSPANGTLMPDPAASGTYYIYIPFGSFHGLDSFTYSISDGTDTAAATVTITVDREPVAVDDSYTTNIDTPVTVNIPGVLANDSDADDDELTASLFDVPSHGTVTVNSNGSFTYAPVAHYNGPDSFTYQASDGILISAPATVRVYVGPPAFGIGLSITGMTYGQILEGVPSTGFPPDTMGAVGPAHIVELLNNSYTVYDKLTGNVLERTKQQTFWTRALGCWFPDRLELGCGSGGTGAGADPRIRYDPPSGRWFASGMTTGNNEIVAVSNSDDPVADGWRAYVIDPDPDFDPNRYQDDFPTLGVDANGVYVDVVQSAPGGGASVIYIPKTALISPSFSVASAVVKGPYVADDTAPQGRMQPVIDQFFEVDGRTPENRQILLGVGKRSDILLAPQPGDDCLAPLEPGDICIAPRLAIDGMPPGVGSFPDGPQPGTLASIHVVSPLAEAYRQGSSIWMTYGGVVTETYGGIERDRNVVRWVQLDASNLDDLRVKNTGVIGTRAEDPRLHFYDSSIAVNTRGDVVIGFTGSGSLAAGSSADVFASAYMVVGRTTPTGEIVFGNVELLQSGYDYWTRHALNDERVRWGDYSATVPDPDPTKRTFWTFQEYVNDRDQWGINITEIRIELGDQRPVAVDEAYSIAENSDLTVGAGGLLSNDSDAEGQPLSVRLSRGPAHGALSLSSNGSFTYTPFSGFQGRDHFTYQVYDGISYSTLASAVVTVNGAPSFLEGPNQPAPGHQLITDERPVGREPNWATNISAGPADESGQALDFILISSDTAIIAYADIDPATGQLTYLVAPNASGTATITVQLKDDGGSPNDPNDDATSDPQTFTITVTKPNPWFNTASPLDINRDGEITGTITNENDDPFDGDAWRLQSFLNGSGTTPVPLNDPIGDPYFYDVNGSRIVSSLDTLTIHNFLNSGSAWYNAPGGPLEADNPLDVNDDDAIDDQDLIDILDYLYSHGLVIIDPEPNPTPFEGYYDIDNDGAVTAADARMLIDFFDPSNNVPSFSVPSSFPYSVSDESVVVRHTNWATQISAGLPNESGQGLEFLVSSSNTALIAYAEIHPSTGRLTFMVAPNASNGTATITVQLKDDGGSPNDPADDLTSAPQTFTITVTTKPNPWYNTASPLDINDDGEITGTEYQNGQPIDGDAWRLQSFLNGSGTTPVPTNAPIGDPYFYDVNGSGIVSGLDLNTIFSYLSAGSAWYNAASPLNVNNDGGTNTQDLIDILDYLYSHGLVIIDPEPNPTPFEGYFDINNDGAVTAADAQILLEFLY